MNLTNTSVNLSESVNTEGNVSMIVRHASIFRFVPFVVTCLGILWNGFLLICFYRNKNAVWIRDTKNVICNIISDFIISILNTVIIAMTVIPDEIQLSLVICYTRNYFTVTLQCVSLNHILFLCIDRFRIAVNIRNLQRQGMSPYKRSLAIWLCTSIYGLVPFLIQMNEHPERMIQCTPSTVALALGTKLVLIIDTVMTTTPWLITNILFIATSFILWRKIRIVQPLKYPMQHADNTIEIRYINRNALTEDRPTGNSIRFISNRNIQSNGIGFRGTNLNVQQRRTKKHVMVTIGLLLVVFNISMWPLVVGLVGLQLSEPFELKGRFYIFLFINQTLNPIIYAFRLARLRQAMKEFFRSCFQRH